MCIFIIIYPIRVPSNNSYDYVYKSNILELLFKD